MGGEDLLLEDVIYFFFNLLKIDSKENLEIEVGIVV